MKLGRANQYPGRCCVCRQDVARERGFLVPGKDARVASLRAKKWLTLCSSAKCVTKLVGAEEVADADRRELHADGTMYCPETDETRPLLDAIGYRDEDGQWYATLRYRDRDAVLRISEALGLSIAPELRDYADPPPVRDAVARAKAFDRDGMRLRDYQIDGVRRLAYAGLLAGEHEREKVLRSAKLHPHFSARGVDKRRGTINADKMGLGKSTQGLFALHEDEALVVVCPANVKPVWPREAKKWRPERFDIYTVCEGSDGFRWPTNPRELVVVNFDVLPPTVAQVKAERAKLLAKRDGKPGDPGASRKAEREGVVGLLPEKAMLAGDEAALFDEGAERTAAGRHAVYLVRAQVVEIEAKLKRLEQALERNSKIKPLPKPTCPIVLIADEAHNVQSNKALRTVRWRQLTRSARRIIGLTGTPVEKEPLVLWGLLQSAVCNPFTWSGFKVQFNAFEGTWGGLDFLREPPALNSTAKGAVKVLPGTTEIVSVVLLQRQKEEVAGELPPRLFSEIPIELTKALLKKLDKIAPAAMEYLERGEMPPFDVMAGVGKALAVASIPTMLEEVEHFESEGKPLVVFSAHRDPIETLHGRPGWAVVTGKGAFIEGKACARGDVEDRFQAGELAGVAGTVAIAEGLTLTHAAHLLQVDPFWSLSKNEQAYDRIHRIGQTAESTHFVMLVPEHPLTRHRAAVLSSKQVFKDAVLSSAGKFVQPGSRFTK